MDLAELARIKRRFSGDDIRAELANAFKLRRQVDHIFPLDDLISQVVADSFDCTQGITPGGEDTIGSFKNFQELAQPYRSHRRKHVQRNTGFGGSHREETFWRNWDGVKAGNGKRRKSWTLRVPRAMQDLHVFCQVDPRSQLPSKRDF